MLTFLSKFIQTLFIFEIINLKVPFIIFKQLFYRKNHKITDQIVRSGKLNFFREGQLFSKHLPF